MYRKRDEKMDEKIFETLKILVKIRKQTNFPVSYEYFAINDCFSIRIAHSKEQFLYRIFDSCFDNKSETSSYKIYKPFSVVLDELKDFCKKHNVDLGE